MPDDPGGIEGLERISRTGCAIMRSVAEKRKTEWSGENRKGVALVSGEVRNLILAISLSTRRQPFLSASASPSVTHHSLRSTSRG